MRDLYDGLAERIDLSAEDRTRRIAHPGRRAGNSTINQFEHQARWAAQRLKLMGLAQPNARERLWEITGKGRDSLHRVVPHVVVTIFVTERGALLGGDAADAISFVDDGSIQALITSPPYPLLRQKQYGNLVEREYLDWMLRIAETWPRKLTKDGSIVLNLGDCWEPGRPVQSLYQERLLVELADKVGLRLSQRYAWLNPSKMPAPAEWVTIRRVRVKPALESVFWLSPHDHPYADNREILTPYSDSMRERIAAGGERGALRPSGHALAQGAFAADNGGAIPPNLITAANTESNGSYLQACRDAGLPIPPARFPAALPEHFIKMLTRPGDTVLDPFFGSGTTGMVAERLGRNWIGFEKMREYAQGAALRFRESAGFEMLAA